MMSLMLNQISSIQPMSAEVVSLVIYLFRVESIKNASPHILIRCLRLSTARTLYIAERVQIREYLNTMTHFLNYCNGTAIMLRNDNDPIILHSVKMMWVRLSKIVLLVSIDSENKMLIVKIYRVGALFYFVLQGI